MKNRVFFLAFLIAVMTIAGSCSKGGSSGGGGTPSPNPGSTAATFGLQGAGGNCTSASIAGNYTQSTALTSANVVTLQVNVTATGTWAVATNSLAGMTFAGSGSFTAIGAQSITLAGSGTPNAAGAQVFSVMVGSAACSFTITVASNAGPWFRPVNAAYVFYYNADKAASIVTTDYSGNNNLALDAASDGSLKVELHNMSNATASMDGTNQSLTFSNQTVAASEAQFNAVVDTTRKPYLRVFSMSGSISVGGNSYSQLILPIVRMNASTDASNGRVIAKQSRFAIADMITIYTNSNHVSNPYQQTFKVR